jgi:hypothetical protein
LIEWSGVLVEMQRLDMNIIEFDGVAQKLQHGVAITFASRQENRGYGGKFKFR